MQCRQLWDYQYLITRPISYYISAFDIYMYVYTYIYGYRTTVYNSIKYVQFYDNIQTIYKFLGNETFLFWVPRQNDMMRSENKQNTKINCAIRPQLCIKCLIVNVHLYMHSKCRSIIIHQSAYQFCHIDFSPQYRFYLMCSIV